MYTKAGIDNLRRQTFGTLEEYTESLFYHLDIELSDDDRAGLLPLIAQAHEKGIATMDLVAIIKDSVR